MGLYDSGQCHGSICRCGVCPGRECGKRLFRIADEIRNLTAKSAEAVQNTNDLISRFRIQ
ncbi:MAG: hypothetical protein HFG69_15095 [Hungatella sp.]|nr:hypothetical protein [Hungatella sp.]